MDYESVVADLKSISEASERQIVLLTLTNSKASNLKHMEGVTLALPLVQL